MRYCFNETFKTKEWELGGKRKFDPNTSIPQSVSHK